jgi:hypothetical protein
VHGRADARGDSSKDRYRRERLSRRNVAVRPERVRPDPGRVPALRRRARQGDSKAACRGEFFCIVTTSHHRRVRSLPATALADARRVASGQTVLTADTARDMRILIVGGTASPPVSLRQLPLTGLLPRARSQRPGRPGRPGLAVQWPSRPSLFWRLRAVSRRRLACARLRCGSIILT